MPVAHSLQSIVAIVQPPPAPVVRARLRDYMAANDLSPGVVAAEIGRLGRSSVQHFLAGTYKRVASRDDIIRARLWQWLERQGKDVDDDIPRRLIRSADTRLLLGLALEAQRKGRFVVVEGPPGTSKTTALRWLAQERARKLQHDTIYFRAFTGITGPALLSWLCRLVGAHSTRTRSGSLLSLTRKLRQRRPCVLLIDEAQNLVEQSIQPFEQLRDVFDMTRCGVLLAGHFRFIKALSNGLARDLEQGISRVDIHKHLQGLQESELPGVEREYFGQEFSADVRKELVRVARVRDRNALLRANGTGRAQAKRGQPVARTYLSFRRVHKFFERVEELRALEENKEKPLAAIARTAASMLLSASERSL